MFPNDITWSVNNFDVSHEEKVASTTSATAPAKDVQVALHLVEVLLRFCRSWRVLNIMHFGFV